MKEEKQIQTIYIENKNTDDDFNLRELFEKYSYYWKWFLVGLLMSLSIAFIYLRYAKDQYKVSSTIFINDKDSGGLSTELSAFEDLGVLGDDKKSSIINETGVLKSRTLIEKVVKDLGINITYYKVGTVTNTELYAEEIPFKINFFLSDSVFNSFYQSISTLTNLQLIKNIGKSTCIFEGLSVVNVIFFDFVSPLLYLFFFALSHRICSYRKNKLN